MFKSKKQGNTPSGGIISSKAKFGRLGIIIVVVVAVLLVGGVAAVTFIGRTGPLAQVLGYTKDAKTDTSKAAGSGGTGTTTAKDEHQAAVEEQQTKIATLVSAGDPASVEKANEIADQQISTAEQTGDDSYIVEANLAKASILINNNENQEAIDTILLPLLDKYQGTDALKYRIYGFLTWAYRGLGNTTKANEYYSQIPVGGGDK